ncbi:heterokaryon incompatibility protein-domain-containing protein [Cercophora newfieldiana]|uniref:Heterokaryon incompatibility protein-domain-containing protein n=1 Tax=Cercophora newfieldiana TaxID=92897 RepID=A0AA39Y3K6_9PEZI|nr:heterokaryon incompatibility protein-domain-containing protein [Cercophora newfieldiana]
MNINFINLITLGAEGLQSAGQSTASFASTSVSGLKNKTKLWAKKPPKFAYHDRIGRDHIRLLRFVHDPFTDDAISDLTLALETHSLAPGSCPSYVALSYTWGPPNMGLMGVRTEYTDIERKPVWINRGVLELRPNLHDLLTQMKASYPPGTYFWADAICINQSDTHERVQQLGIMDVVYTRAIKTVVWLGKKTQLTPKAAEILHRNAGATRAAFPRIMQSLMAGQHQPPIHADETSLLWDRFGILPLTKADWEILADVYSRRWFGRSWMVQEVALSPVLEVLCGDVAFDWDVIALPAVVLSLTHTTMSLVSVYLTTNLPIIFSAMGMTHAAGLHMARMWCHSQTHQTSLLASLDLSAGLPASGPASLLLKLATATFGFVATHRRDKFYALHGILHRIANFNYTEHPTLAPSYSPDISDADVCRSTCEAIIQETGTLHIITLGGYAGYLYRVDEVPGVIRGTKFFRKLTDLAPQHRLPELATWAPDFNPYRLSLPLLGPSFHPIGFDASGAGSQIHGLKGEMRPVVEGQRLWGMGIDDSARRPASADLGSMFRGWMVYVVLKRLLSRLDPVRMVNRGAIPAMIEAFFAENEAMERLALVDDFFPSRAELRKRLAWLGYIEDVKGVTAAPAGKEACLKAWERAARDFDLFAQLYAQFKRVFVTDSGHLGAANQALGVGHGVWILAGCPTPMVLVPDEKNGGYKVFGDAYLHGMMFGEAVGGASWERICLV